MAIKFHDGVVAPQEKSEERAKEYAQTVNKIENAVFRNNLNALFSQDEILATRLFSLGEQKNYEVFIGKDPIDINIIDKKTLSYVYEKPASDIQNMLEGLGSQCKRYPVMFFYGLGNGVFYKALLYNQTHQHIIVVEPDLEILYITLNLVDLSKELLSERLIIFYSELTTYSQIYQLMIGQVYSVYAKTYNFHVHTPFYDKFADDYNKINQFFVRAISQVVTSHGNSVDDLLQGVRNNTQNLPQLIKGYVYQDLIKKRKGLMDTAVIVATGPSLDKQLDTLKKFAPYVTVISLDASLPILAKHGIKPDYVTSIERVIETSSFFKKRNGNLDKDAYFIVASLTHPQSVKNILPRRLVLTFRPQAERAMGLNKHGYLGIGLSTANQAYQLAYTLDHKNIVLIGQDLAFAPDGKSHATGHAFAQADENLYTTAYGGVGEVRTTYVWDKFKNQYESDIESTNKKGIKNYNCTEGGAMIKGTIEKPFIQVMEELTSGKEIKQKLEEVFLEITPDIDKMIEIRDKGELGEKHFKKLLSITKKIDKIKNFVGRQQYRRYIEYILSISVYYQELELAKISVESSDEVMQKVNKLAEWVEMHKYWIFSLAGGLDAEIKTTKKASKNLLKEVKKLGLI